MPVSRQRGFTLLEIMLVLVIIGVMVGLVSVATGANAHSRLEREARRLHTVLQMAADEALMQGVQWSLALPGQGYQFLVFDHEQVQWRRVQSAPFAPYLLDTVFTLSLTVEDQRLDPEALAQIKRMQSIDTDQALQPAILLLASGEITPFRLTLRHAELKAGITLQSDGVNAIELTGEVNTGG